jgi:hypothetical protein
VRFRQNNDVHAVLIFQDGCLSHSRGEFSQSFKKFIEVTDVKTTWGLTKATLYVRSSASQAELDADRKPITMKAIQNTDAMQRWDAIGETYRFGSVDFTRPPVRMQSITANFALKYNNICFKMFHYPLYPTER